MIDLGPDDLMDLIREVLDGEADLPADAYEQFVLELARVYCKYMGCTVESLSTYDGVCVTISEEGGYEF